MNKKEESWFIRIPYVKEDVFSPNNYVLTDADIKRLRGKAEKEGRSLGKFIAYHLKQIK